MLLCSLVVQLLSCVWLFVTPTDCSRSCFPVLHHFPEFAQVKLFSHVWLFATPWTVACQAPLFMGFSRQEYWSGLSFPPPKDLPNPGTKPASPALVGGYLITEPPGKPRITYWKIHKWNSMSEICFVFTSKGRKCGDGCTKISQELITVESTLWL